MGVQLSSKESIKVWIEIGTNRILGFSPEFCQRPLVPLSFKFKSETLLHARDIENWIAKYRIQQEEDAYRATLVQIRREGIFRKNLASAIRARNTQVNPFNRDLNNTLIRLMDEKYDAMLNRKLKPVVHGMNEAYEAGTTAEDVAMDGSYAKQPSGIDHVNGGVV